MALDGFAGTERIVGIADVPDGQYYTEAVAWAKEAGITVGTSPTTFDPVVS